MNALELARTAYTSPASPTRTERGAEYETIARVTGELRQATQDRQRNFKRFVAALHRNRRLWTILAANVADKDNALPRELRAKLFYLAEFTLKQTQDILAKRGEPDILVEINTAVLHGLRSGEAPPIPTGPRA
ncbi:MAG: flagellar biosynthesis regulator FlaF [Pseudomonadota bacterium]